MNTESEKNLVPSEKNLINGKKEIPLGTDISKKICMLKYYVDSKQATRADLEEIFKLMFHLMYHHRYGVLYNVLKKSF